MCPLLLRTMDDFWVMRGYPEPGGLSRKARYARELEVLRRDDDDAKTPAGHTKSELTPRPCQTAIVSLTGDLIGWCAPPFDPSPCVYGAIRQRKY